VARDVFKRLFKLSRRITAEVFLPLLISGFEEANPDWRAREVLVYLAGTVAMGLSTHHTESINTIISHILNALLEDLEVLPHSHTLSR